MEFDLTQLGNQIEQPKSPDEATLEVIPNHWKDSSYVVNLFCEEFTCICPVTGQPDFAEMHIQYIPNETLVESKSLKFYLGSYRNHGIFHEFVVNKILDDLKTALNPKWIEVRGEFRSRGGIRIVPVATYGSKK